MLTKQRLGSLFLVSGMILASWCAGQVVYAAEPFTLTSRRSRTVSRWTSNSGDKDDRVVSNVSPPFVWSNPPAGTKSFALIMVDPEGEVVGVVQLGCLRHSRFGDRVRGGRGGQAFAQLRRRQRKIAGAAAYT